MITTTTLSNKKKNDNIMKKQDNPNLDEAIERGWEIPDYTIKQLRNAIPSHCFRRDTFYSLSYVLHDAIFVTILAFSASYIDMVPSVSLRVGLWSIYWVLQGIVAMGVWVLGHECGHQAFSPSKTINNSVGLVLHSLLLTPYHSWRISHSRHHKGTGSMSKDEIYVPLTRSKRGMPSRQRDPEGDGPHVAFEQSPLATLYSMFSMFVLGWPLYLINNFGGRHYGSTSWISHLNPKCDIFNEHHFWEVTESVGGILSTIGFLGYLCQNLGIMTVIKFYGIPYIFLNFWLVLITYLHHTHPEIPHYRDGVWNFQRGASLTIDRSYGKFIDHFHHHISDTHVVHHLFSTIPHYHAQEATFYLKKAMGKHYQSDNTPIPLAFWQSWTRCYYVEDEGDVVFYKH